MIYHDAILVIYNARNDAVDIVGEVTDFEAFCHAIQIGNIKNVRLRCRACGQAILNAHDRSKP